MSFESLNNLLDDFGPVVLNENLYLSRALIDGETPNLKWSGVNQIGEFGYDAESNSYFISVKPIADGLEPWQISELVFAIKDMFSAARI